MIIDLNTEEKKQELYKLFDSFAKIGDIYDYFHLSDSSKNVKYIREIAQEIGFDLSVYQQRRYPIKYCLQCGKELKNRRNTFCSSSCSATYNNSHRSPMSDETKLKISNSLKNQNDVTQKYCLQCGKELTNRQTKFCSLKCQGEFNKQNNKRHYETLICENCGKEFVGLTGRKYCCSECANEKLKKSRIKKFIEGNYKLNGNNTTPNFIREYLFEKNNYKCEVCGYEGYNIKTGKTILQIHHKDGNSNNNIPENLQVICPNCHAKTENYMALNKGNSSRDKRYKK